MTTSHGIKSDVRYRASPGTARTVSSAQLILLQPFIFYQCLMADRNGRIMPLYSVPRPPPFHIFIEIAHNGGVLLYVFVTGANFCTDSLMGGLTANDGAARLFMRMHSLENGADWLPVHWERENNNKKSGLHRKSLI